jgi:hypothetical protein
MVLPYVIALEFLVFAIERVHKNIRHLAGCPTFAQYYPRKQLVIY